MTSSWEIFNSIVTQPWVLALVSFIVLFALLSASFRMLWNFLMRWARSFRPNWPAGHLLAMRKPLQLVVFFISAYISIRLSVESGSSTVGWLNAALKVLSIVCGVWLLERLALLLIVANSSRISSSSATRDLLLLVTRISVISIGTLVVLDNLGISITPILASLGVGSVAVALALQDTLSNFLSGIYLLVDQPIRVGDFIKAESDEGYVKKIGWRSTQIQLLSNNVVIIPNSKIATSRLTNFDLFDQESSVVVPVAVDYKSDLNDVEKVAIEVASQVLRQTEGGVKNFQPFIRFYKLGDSGIEFNVILRARQFADSYVIRHEFIKALVQRFSQEGIEIPFPQRVVQIQRTKNLNAP